MLRHFLDFPPAVRVWNLSYLALALLTGTFVPLIALIGLLTSGGGHPQPSNAIDIGVTVGQAVAVVQGVIFIAWMIALLAYSRLSSEPGLLRNVGNALRRGAWLVAGLTVLNVVVVTSACSFMECVSG